MNWMKVTAYATVLFAAQVTIGFLGASFPIDSGIGPAIIGYASSFVVCGAIFVHLGIHQPSRPFAHAWAALALQVVVASALAQALVGWLSNASTALVAIEWLVLICSLWAGTAVGSSLRQRPEESADA